MGHALVQWASHADTGLPEDDMVNTWHFETSGSVSSAASGLVTLVNAFYNTGAPTAKVSDFRSMFLNDAWTAKVYDMGQATPRVPVLTSTGTYPGTITSQSLPAEVSVCLSFSAVAASGTIPARRRGRVFLGPLSVDALSGTKPIVLASFRTTIGTAALRLKNDTITAGHIWSIYSKANSSLVGVSYGWVDEAFDTQRRRGQKSTARSTWGP